MILDVDATEIEAEKQDAPWIYHHLQGYMPLLGYVGGVCVGHEFWQGNQSLGAGILEFAQRCEGTLPAGKHLYFRSDTAAFQAAVINHYSRPGRSFGITADLDSAVKREIQNLEVIWKYNQRGNSENWHKELKVGLGIEQMPCGQFEANALYFAIGVRDTEVGVKRP